MRRKKWNNYVAKWSVLPCPIHECDAVLFFFRYDWDRVIILIGHRCHEASEVVFLCGAPQHRL